MTGKDIIALGYKQDAWFGVALQELNKNPLEGEELRSYLDSLVPKYIEVRDKPIEYALNIKGETEEELFNIMSVQETMEELLLTPTIIDACVMPDACPTGEKGVIPVGGVVIAKNAIHPGMHSADICCSVMLTGFGSIDPEVVLNAIENITDFGAGPRKKMWFDKPVEIIERMEDNPFFTKKAIGFAHSHLGTQGDGNHFAYVGVRESDGSTCLVTHHGSRGVGAELYKEGMKCAEKWRKRLSPNTLKVNAWIPYDTEEGRDYWEALQIVRDWTKLNHEVLHDSVKDKLKYNSGVRFWNEHNFVFKGGVDNFFHAKGATPMIDHFVPDNDTGLRLIPLNMAEPILIATRSNSEGVGALGFAPHGAGRNVSRTAHKKSGKADLALETKGLDARFYTGIPDVSELPSAYKNARQVIEQIDEFNLANVVDRVNPYGCIMAGESHIIYSHRKKKR